MRFADLNQDSYRRLSIGPSITFDWFLIPTKTINKLEKKKVKKKVKKKANPILCPLTLKLKVESNVVDAF